MATSPDYINAEQIAAELGVHISTVRRHFRAGGLRGRKVGHSWVTTRATFDAWLTGTAPPAPRNETQVVHVEGASPSAVAEAMARRAATSGAAAL